MRQFAWFGLLAVLLLSNIDPAYGQTTKLVVAYASPAATFSPGWIARRQGIFAKYNLDVDMVLMQGASTYMPALASGNIQVLYGGGTAVSRAIATGSFDLMVIATETRYVPLRLMVVPSIRGVADIRGKKLGVGRAGLDEYATLLYLEKLGLSPGKDVDLVYITGGVPSRAAAMKQGLIHGVAVNPPNEYELEKAGYREFANFLDFKMPYAGVPHTISKKFRDANRKIVEDYMTAMVEGMQIFRSDKQAAFNAIIELTRQKDPVLLERTYDSFAKQYDAIGGIPLPWQSGFESMIIGFHERFNPQGVKNRDAKPFLDPSFVQKAAERLKLSGK
ncbi:MAG TPA: ABC transporter substrate-binding protein [Candidatus Limnocylindria bacterium]|nr:ABC transporter substrate-binding protein [Candidatus Limnocylindria bacterium]